MDPESAKPGPDTRAAEQAVRKFLHTQAALPGEFIGPYRILDRIGAGGMGVVYRAELRQGNLLLKVALKVIQPGALSESVRRRFEFEAQALAAMAHDAIAKVHGAGVTASGDPYIAMELVEGIELNRFCDEHRLGLEARIRLFQRVCAAVDHAHRKLVIHRDLKPGNVLVADRDGLPTPKIIDFGIARAMDRDAEAGPSLTEEGRIGGTREYMSPEQAAGRSADVDTRTDVYSLGAMLYELLTSELPFGSERLRGLAWSDFERVLREEAPPRPSMRVTPKSTHAIMETRGTTADSLARELRRDLDWIVLKALAKEPDRRYASASDLAADLQRYLEHQPVLAGPPSAGYRVRKFVRRYRMPVMAAGAVLTALVAGGIGTGLGFAEATARVREFDQLAGVVLYERAVETEMRLYPAWPRQIEALERWLRGDAQKLMAMRPGIGRAVASLRAQALPATAEELERDRTAHPKHGEWQEQAARLASLERAHAIRTRAQQLKLPLPTPEEQAMTVAQLNELAWQRVDWDESKRIWGEEARALSLAQLVWSRAADLPADYRAWYGDTLAWAWFANGKDAEALAQSEASLAVASADRREEYKGHLALLQARVTAATGEAGSKALADLRSAVGALAADVSVRRSFRFADTSQQFLHDTLSDLLVKVSSLDSKERKAVDERLSWAKRLTALTFRHPNAQITWQAAREAIAKADDVVASKLYGTHSIDLCDQNVMGLVPIGMNPATKLWEFYDLRSAWDGVSDPATIAIPRHVTEGERHGHIPVGDETGIVFVLLPGGVFTMGAQRQDPNGANHDAYATDLETPHRVTLSPFLLARHELTQGQWKRLVGGEIPSLYHPAYVWVGGSGQVGQRFSWSNPVENVSWDECERCLWRHGMILPTEAQWEYGCRAGTTTTWWTGNERQSVRGAVNLADKTRLAGGGRGPTSIEPGLEDGFIVHAPVDALLPNGFGLHHVHGNVWEWCEDWFGFYSLPCRAGDGLRLGTKLRARVYRGGGHASLATDARSATRSRNVPSLRSELLGVRPARALTP